MSSRNTELTLVPLVRRLTNILGGLIQSSASPFGEPHPLYAIVTVTGLGALDLSAIGVLVWADGGVGLRALSQSALAEPATNAPHPLLLVDFHDCHHPLLRRWSRWRQQAYAQRGWFAPGVDPVQARRAVSRQQINQRIAMSYESLIRSGFPDRDRPGEAVYYVRRPRNDRQRFQRIILPASKEPTVEQIVATDNLLRVYYELKTRAGQAPGPDGITYADWGRREVTSILRALNAAVCAGRYRPQKSRAVPIPKANGGVRILRIANLCDRVIATALHQALEPVWEPIFLPCSMGFRRGRGMLRLLAELERIMIDQDRWVLAIDDIQKAFDNVPIDDVMMDHARYLTDPSLLSLIEVVLRGGDGQRRKQGIDQGNAYSPTALNIRLHHAHDLGVQQGPNPPWFRYADNLVYISQDVPEGQQTLDRARHLLGRPALPSKARTDPQ